MRQRRKMWSDWPLRLLFAAGFVLAAANAVSAQPLGQLFGYDSDEDEVEEPGRLLPENFFDSVPRAARGDIAVEADNLVFNADANKVMASGNVLMSYEGYVATADRAEYDRGTGDLVLIGNAVVRDPEQVVYLGDRIHVTGDFKDAFVTALQMQTPDGALVTGSEVEYRDQMIAILENGSYSPCGTCIDANGNRIGWRVKTTKMVLNREEKTLYLERPTVELLGHDTLSVPFYWMPDPTDPRSPGFRLPRTRFNQGYGLAVLAPYFYPISTETDLWLTPMLMSRQGFLLDGELTQRFGSDNEVAVRASGVYQLDRSAFLGEVGDRTWRGALQITGEFTPAPQWRAGWSYLAFTDPAFIGDYDLSGYDRTNDVFAQHLSDHVFFDARIQEFLLSGQASQISQDRQGRTIPVARFDKYFEVDDAGGQVLLSGDFIGVNRGLDAQRTVNGVNYIDGYAGNSFHGTIEGGWQRQFIVPGGLAATPYLGLRLDAANYDGGSALMPVASTLFTPTPIAAIDLRFPVRATDGMSTYIFEPIAQLVYRGSSTSLVGITNQSAQSFVFEDTNLFSFNRFSSNDRQETGLRANIGGQMQANFYDGSWLRLIGGQSYHLAGVNAFSVFDHAQVGNGSGLSATNSFIVAGLTAGIGNFVQFGGKAELDPATGLIARGTTAVALDINQFTLDTAYSYRRAIASRGELTDAHTISAEVGVPVADYWTINGSANWNITANNWTTIGAGVAYDDEFLSYGFNYQAKQNLNTLAIKHFFGVDFLLSGP